MIDSTAMEICGPSLSRIARGVLFAALLSLSAAGSYAASGGGPVQPDIADDASDVIATIHAAMVRRAAALGAPVTAAPSRAAASLFQYPLRLSPSAGGFAGEAISNHVDHDPGTGLQDFACGTRTYDGHHGTDIFLTPYRWNVMDRKEVQVVAALPGVIISKKDGEFDRQCNLPPVPPPANYVIIRHDNGLLAYYWHLKNGSVTRKAVGARVALGEPLGFVGSSGNSTGPHLHFEVRDAGGAVVDPYAGRCNSGGTRWTHQSRPVDPGVVRVATHSVAPPVPTDRCENINPRYATSFAPGATVYAAAYLRDQTPSTRALISILRPNGSTATSFPSGAPSSGFWTVSYWWISYALPRNAPPGDWRVRVVFAGNAYDQVFVVRNAAPRATITAAVASPVRAVRAGEPANFTVTLANTSTAKAVGCRISLSRPIDADVKFRRLTASGMPTGPVNYAFAIPPSQALKALLTVTPRSGFRASAAEFPLFAKCANSAGTAFSRAGTVLTLTSR